MNERSRESEHAATAAQDEAERQKDEKWIKRQGKVDRTKQTPRKGTGYKAIIGMIGVMLDPTWTSYETLRERCD